MVIPSEYEPFGLVVNEAMLCDCVVVAVAMHLGDKPEHSTGARDAGRDGLAMDEQLRMTPEHFACDEAKDRQNNSHQPSSREYIHGSFAARQCS